MILRVINTSVITILIMEKETFVYYTKQSIVSMTKNVSTFDFQ